MKRLHIIHPITVYEFHGKYYGNPISVAVYSEFTKYFSVVMHVNVQEIVSVDNELSEFSNKNIYFEDFFEDLSFLDFLKKIIIYRNKLLALPKNDIYFCSYPFKRIGYFLAFFLRKRNLVLWVRSDIAGVYRSNPFAIYGFSFKAIYRLIIGRPRALAYEVLSKFLFRRKLIFYSANITVNKENHINQYEIISCSPLNKNRSLISHSVSYSICFVGGEGEQKGLHILLKALQTSYFKQKITLHIIGIDKLYKKRNKNLMKEINVKFHGKIHQREKLFRIMAQNDILVMPSFGEKQGKVQLEAMSVGVVPICSDSGGTYMTIKNFYNGLLFKPGDYKQLKENIELLYSDNGLYKTLKENGLEYISILSMEKEIKKMSDVIRGHYLS